MKSWNLAATILALTVALGALDLSGAIGVHTSRAAGVTSAANAGSPGFSSAASTKDADAEDANDERDAELINTFLVSPRNPAPTGARAALALRYD